jgi:hypothetical protein
VKSRRNLRSASPLALAVSEDPPPMFICTPGNQTCKRLEVFSTCGRSFGMYHSVGEKALRRSSRARAWKACSISVID